MRITVFTVCMVHLFMEIKIRLHKDYFAAAIEQAKTFAYKDYAEV